MRVYCISEYASIYYIGACCKKCACVYRMKVSIIPSIIYMYRVLKTVVGVGQCHPPVLSKCTLDRTHTHSKLVSISYLIFGFDLIYQVLTDVQVLATFANCLPACPISRFPSQVIDHHIASNTNPTPPEPYHLALMCFDHGRLRG